MTAPRTLVLTCAKCGEVFQADRKPVGRHPKFCSSVCRRAAARESQSLRRRNRAPALNAAPLKLTCDQCGNSFTAERNARGRRLHFCSAKCRRAAIVRRVRQYRLERRYERSAVCVVCGGGFSTIYAAVACGPACAAELGRRSRRLKRGQLDLFEALGR
jgi:endogenous inhibitor of DNA gyrase (YacG/DUF329 family)